MHGGGRRFKPCQLHKNFSFLLFEIVSFCSFNKNIRAFLLKNVPIKVREYFYWGKQVIRILLFIVNYVIKALIKLIRAYGGCLGI